MKTIHLKNILMAAFDQPLNAHFLPAKHRDNGKSQLTFSEYRKQEPGSKRMCLIFKVMGVFEHTSQDISIKLDPKYQPDNILGQILTAMGYKPELKELEYGFEQIVFNNLGESIDKFLDDKKGAVYAAKVNEKTVEVGTISTDVWEIDITTLELLHQPDNTTVFDELGIKRD